MDEIQKIYGHDPMWPKVKKNDRWLEFLALTILDQRDGTNKAAYYEGRNEKA